VCILQPPTAVFQRLGALQQASAGREGGGVVAVGVVGRWEAGA
jgi:hypothetical protein